jgi:hypothetical protein
MESRIRKKNTEELPQNQAFNQKQDINNAKTKKHFPMPGQ